MSHRVAVAFTNGVGVQSSACKHEEHALCAPNGRVRLVHGKTIGCDCDCHIAYRKALRALRARKERERERHQTEDAANG